MTYLEHGCVWEDYLERVDKTIQSLTNVNQLCENLTKSMWLINNNVIETMKKKWRKHLPPHQTFVSIYFKRNIIYLQSAHILASIGFRDPSRCIERTVLESILRGYHFIVDHKEANHYYSLIGTRKEQSYLKNKNILRLLQELHTHGRRKKWRRVYSELCVSAHAEIKGAFLDYPIYDKSLIEPELKTILMLVYGNIQMMAECFLDFHDTDLKTFAGNQLSDIGNSIGYCPLIEPNKRKYGSKIKLKEGNLTYLFADELAS